MGDHGGGTASATRARRRAAVPVRAAVALAAVLAVSLSGCGEVSTPTAAPTPVATADLTGTGPGTLISAESLPGIDRSIRALGGTSVKVRYRSTSGIDGSITDVSGAVFLPPGDAPDGGWPVIAFAHGTSGVLRECAPSLSPDLFGSAGLVASYLGLGFAVAAPDYQGLDGPGGHPYLDNRTAGLNVIDAVRALRRVSPTVSARWGVFGGSQGGGAAWAANEQAGEYAPELSLVGSVSLVPTADLSAYPALAAAGTMTEDQRAAYVWILNGMEQTRPGFRLDDYVHGVARENWDTLAVCTGPRGAQRAQLLRDMAPSDLVPSSPAAQAAITDTLRSMALPQRRATAPLLIIYAGQDTFIDPEWTRAAIDRACALGDVVQSDFQPDRGHGDVDGSAYVSWLGERFEGRPAPDGCPRA